MAHVLAQLGQGSLRDRPDGWSPGRVWSISSAARRGWLGASRRCCACPAPNLSAHESVSTPCSSQPARHLALSPISDHDQQSACFSFSCPLARPPNMALATPLLTPLLSRTTSATGTPALAATAPVSGRATPSTPRKGGGSVVLGRHSWGRPPWYNQHGQAATSYVIGIAGGSASGKVRLDRHASSTCLLS